MSHVKPGLNALRIPCTKPGCNRWFKNKSGLTQHTNTVHSVFTTSTAPLCPPQSNRSPSPLFYADINPEEYDGANLNEEYCAATPGPVQPPAEFFGPGDRLYQNYHPNLTASLIRGGANTSALFTDHRDVYKTIDSTHLGDVQWQSCLLKYTGEHAVDDTAPWMEDSYNVWFHDPHDVVQNMLANPDYTLEMDLQPYREFVTETDECQWQDFMSGDWAWNQVDQISDDLDTHGSTFVPVILGSNKTTVSVATGQNNYYPLYVSIGSVRNNVCCAHHNVVAVIGFLAMPKTTKQHAKTANFHNFCHQLFYSSLSYILKNLKPAMTKPEVACFGDSHYRHVIYGLGPYIADYEEQVLLMCIVKNWCTKCLSYRKSLDNDSLQRSKTHTKALIKECDHLALWDEFGIVAQLMLLHQIIKGVFKDHLVVWVEKYLVQMHGQTQADVILDDIDRSSSCIFGTAPIPSRMQLQQWTRDNSKVLMKVYLAAIEGYVPVEIVRTFCAFLKFSLGQMLMTNQCLDKLTASHQDFRARGMLNGTCLSSRAWCIPGLSAELNIPNLAELSNPNNAHDPTKVSLLESPYYWGRISVFNSVDLSGIGGMKHEYIRACPLWRNKCACNDYTHGMGGMDVAHVMAFFSLQQHGKQVPCAVVRWFNRVGDAPDPDTGMWLVKPAFAANRTPHFAVIHIDTIFCVAHLIPVYGTAPLSPLIKYHHVLDIFKLFYVNKFADHHAFKIAC
ncbi:hypothetical protein BD769DRAFT_1630402 [Suillus cothurnatus]|nr:hypothetical protein BD769DRAFT_1630402 [Suillus cothurnatus]